MLGRITSTTELLMLMGKPIRHSRSPLMHNEAFRALGLDYAYMCFEVDNDNLESAINMMRDLGIRGGNVTMPNKIKVIEYLDEISKEAELCGAVNTIVNENGRLIGHITDGLGYIRALQDAGYEPEGKKLTIVGGGGVGKSIQVSLAMNGAREISVFNKRDSFWGRTEETVDMINSETDCHAKLYDLDDLDRLKSEIHSSDIVTNATRMGMKPLEGLTFVPDSSFFWEGMLATDVVYVPRETEFLRLARTAGCRTMNGQSMMLFQGAEAFKMWTGREMPIDHMKEYLEI